VTRRGAFKTKLSACGLVYKHYGRMVLSELRPDLRGATLELVYTKMYEQMIEAIDADGNDVNSGARFIDKTTLTARLERMNARWNAVVPHDENAAFERASNLAGLEFTTHLDYLVDCWLPARDIVKTALDLRMDVDSSGFMIRLENDRIPWKEHLYMLERERGIASHIKFVLYNDVQSGMWRVQAVAVEGADFASRLSLPSAWCGLTGQTLCDAAGIEGCTFVQKAGFAGGNVTYEGALKMARVALGDLVSPT